MTAETNTVRVHILDKDYQVACPPEEHDALIESARYLDQQMRTIRQSGKVIGMERIAVMAALNITHELIQHGERSDQGSHDIDERLRRLASRIDDTLDNFRQLEI
jgi:cell division protein ZapA